MSVSELKEKLNELAVDAGYNGLDDYIHKAVNTDNTMQFLNDSLADLDYTAEEFIKLFFELFDKLPTTIKEDIRKL